MIRPREQPPALCAPVAGWRLALSWRRVGSILRRVCPCALLLTLWGSGAAVAQDLGRDGGVVQSQSLGPDPTAESRLSLQARGRDLARWQPGEREGYFDEQERQHQASQVKGYYRKMALRALRRWSGDCFGSLLTDDGMRLPCHLNGAGTGSATGTMARLVNDTDVELHYGDGGASLSFGRDLDLGRIGCRSGRLEVDPVRGEVELGVDLDRTSLAWTVGNGQMRLSWSIPF